MRVQTIIGQTSATNNRQKVSTQPQKANDPIAFGTRLILSEQSATGLRQIIKEFEELDLNEIKYTHNKPEIGEALGTLGKHVNLFVRRLVKDLISHNSNEANHLFTKPQAILDPVYIRFDSFRTPIAKLADDKVLEATKKGFICHIQDRPYLIKVVDEDTINIGLLNRVGSVVDDVRGNLITYHDKYRPGELPTDQLLEKVTQIIPPKVEEVPPKKSFLIRLLSEKPNYIKHP